MDHRHNLCVQVLKTALHSATPNLPIGKTSSNRTTLQDIVNRSTLLPSKIVVVGAWRTNSYLVFTFEDGTSAVRVSQSKEVELGKGFFHC